MEEVQMASEGFQSPQNNYPQQPPPPPTKQSFWKRKAGCMPTWLLIVIIGIISLYILVSIVSAASNGGNGIGNTDSTPTQAPTQPTATPDTAKVVPQVTEYPTDTPAPAQPTDTPAPPTTAPTKQSAIHPTHGTPHLGGPISDFYGKYGSHIFGTVQSGSAPR
jgi:hypothetical protein